MKYRYQSNRLLLLLIATIPVFCNTGCSIDRFRYFIRTGIDPGPSYTRSETPDTARETPPIVRPRQVRNNRKPPKPYGSVVNIRIGTIQMPSRSPEVVERLWNYLDEEPVALRSKPLVLNGLRVGLGTPETWDDVQEVLKELTSKAVKIADLKSYFGHTSPLVVRRQRPQQTIFTYSETNRLTGHDYPAGDNILLLQPLINRYEKSSIILTVQPQIRTTKHYSSFAIRDGVRTLVDQPRIYTFDPITFSLVIPGNHFLVIGPGPMSKRTSSVGYNFMTTQKEGVLFDKLLILKPIPVENKPESE